MLFRATLAVALAAAPAVVLACGDENGECCEYSGFGTGYCSGTLACWEGLCMPCGKDGTPACAGVPAPSRPALCMLTGCLLALIGPRLSTNKQQ